MLPFRRNTYAEEEHLFSDSSAFCANGTMILTRKIYLTAHLADNYKQNVKRFQHKPPRDIQFAHPYT